MGRKLTGSIRTIDDTTIEVSVPTKRGSKERAYAYFTDMEAAEMWRASAINALYQDEPIPAAPRTPSPTAELRTVDGRSEWLEHFIRETIDERYSEFRSGGGERYKDVLSTLEVHILPYFTEAVKVPEDYTRGVVKQFVLRLTGNRSAAFTIAEAAALTGKSERHLRRLVDSGKLPRSDKGYRSDLTFVAIGDLEKALGVERLRVAYAPSTAKDVFTIWKMIETRLVAEGVFDRAVAPGIKVPPVDPDARRRAARVKGEAVPLKAVAEVSVHLHVVYQTALWLLRICGLRISEAYGIRIGDILDYGSETRPGIVAIERQGGRGFLERDDAGNLCIVDSKETLKTTGSVRVIAVPPTLMTLINSIISIFHTDRTTGAVNMDARLIPGLREDNRAGQAGFRGALKAACLAEEIRGGLEERFVPHDLRASLITDLAYGEVDELLRRTYVGHVPGSDVHSGYIRVTKNAEALFVIAEQLEADIQREIGSLMIPTLKRPMFGHASTLHSISAEIHNDLIDIGWQLEHLDDNGNPCLDVPELAAELDCSNNTARRLIAAGAFPTSGEGDVQRVAFSDLEAHKASRLPNLRDVADRTGVDYYRLYRIMQQLDIKADVDPISGKLAINGDIETALLDEVARVDALHERACNVHKASMRLHKAASVVRQMIRIGELEIDPETDATGARFIPHAVIDEYLASQESSNRS